MGDAIHIIGTIENRNTNGDGGNGIYVGKKIIVNNGSAINVG